MSNTEVGVLIDAKQPRDAIHIAVAPVCATKEITPGSPIAFVEGSNTEVGMAPWGVSVGIVDPFLRKPVKKGEWFWMWLHPNTITSLRHNWTHPAFNEQLGYKPPQADAEKWLRELGEKYDYSYQDLVKAGVDFIDKGTYLTRDGNLDITNYWNDDEHQKYWECIHLITGKEPNDRSDAPFTCSC